MDLLFWLALLWAGSKAVVLGFAELGAFLVAHERWGVLALLLFWFLLRQRQDASSLFFFSSLVLLFKQFGLQLFNFVWDGLLTLLYTLFLISFGVGFSHVPVSFVVLLNILSRFFCCLFRPLSSDRRLGYQVSCSPSQGKEIVTLDNTMILHQMTLED
ncbi:uncharacterized protein LOC133699451 [Populus nigra]|uniref:uncharacterized protein LOC133699451 n=1 Tax=Populus nigra TaxID=3691 RepID=UPI002B275E98|nr:uncharacterized protein LOC133699451 [Populus nigra]